LFSFALLLFEDAAQVDPGAFELVYAGHTVAPVDYLAGQFPPLARVEGDPLLLVLRALLCLLFLSIAHLLLPHIL
jgi:hypothetical protein